MSCTLHGLFLCASIRMCQKKQEGGGSLQVLPETMEPAARVLQRAWRARSSHLLAVTRRALRELAECCVCRDECVQTVRCPNGHARCLGCFESSVNNFRCPVCRCACTSSAPDRTFELVVCVARLPYECGTCGQHIPASACEAHRAWCPAHQFRCVAGSCPELCVAEDMAAHVARAHGVPTLSVQRGGVYHAVVALHRGSASPDTPALVCVGSTVVVFNLYAHLMPRPGGPLFGHRRSIAASLYVRACYSSPLAPALHLTVRQLRLADCLTPNSWTDEHRCGMITPLLASHVGTEPVHVPVLTAACACVAPLPTEGGGVCHAIVADALPDPTVARMLRGRGIRDTGDDESESFYLLHVLLREDANVRVGDVCP